MKKIVASFVLTIACVSLVGQTSKNVLFIGNSYTGNNNLPSLTSSLATSLGDNLSTGQNTPGGATFNAQSTNSTTLSKIAQGGWDYVVLQAQSQEPSFPPSQVASETYPYAAILVDSILSADPCSVPLFFMTWGRENGDQNNCQFYAPLCSYDGMQNRLRNSYLEMGMDNVAEVSPVGATWQYVRDNYPNIDLYGTDGSHPNINGSYLAACVHYASIFKKSPVGATFISSLSASDALILQTAAELIVLDNDSMAVWNFGARDVSADFSSSVSDFDVDFNYTGNNGTEYDWNFGDGNSSHANSPSNTYLVNGTYTVELAVTNGCTSDTISQDVTIAVSSSQVEELKYVQNIAQKDGWCQVTFKEQRNGYFEVYDVSGKIVAQQKFSSSEFSFDLPDTSGVYVLSMSFEDHQRQTITLVR